MTRNIAHIEQDITRAKKILENCAKANTFTEQIAEMTQEDLQKLYHERNNELGKAVKHE